MEVCDIFNFKVNIPLDNTCLGHRYRGISHSYAGHDAFSGSISICKLLNILHLLNVRVFLCLPLLLHICAVVGTPVHVSN